MTKKILIYLNFFVTCLVAPFIFQFLLQFIAVSNNIKEIRIPGIVTQDLINVYNANGKFGSFVSFPDTILYSFVLTIVLILINLKFNKNNYD